MRATSHILQDLDKLSEILPIMDRISARLSAQLKTGEKTVWDYLPDARSALDGEDVTAAISDLKQAKSLLQSLGGSSAIPESCLLTPCKYTDLALQALEVWFPVRIQICTPPLFPAHFVERRGMGSAEW